MATRSRTSFQKRQKEIARAEKQRDKVAKRQQRKLEGGLPPDPDDELLADDANPEDGNAENADAEHGNAENGNPEGAPVEPNSRV